MENDEWIRKALNRPERDAELMKTGADVTLHPLAGCTTGTLPENNVMLILEFLVPPPEMTTRILRLSMTRAQCIEMAKLLDRLARAPHVLPPDKPS